MDKVDNKRLEKLKQQRSQLSARIQSIEAREKHQDRKKETRRKILIGAYYWDKAKLEGQEDEVKQLMDGYLSRDSDRALFDLPMLKQEVEVTNKENTEDMQE